MPVENENFNIDPHTQLRYPAREATPFAEATSAGMQLVNPFSRASARLATDMPVFNPSFDPLEGYNPYTDDTTRGYPVEPFRESLSPQESAYIANQIKENYELQQKANLTGQIVGSIGNPLFLAAAYLAPASIPALIATEAAAEVLNEVALHSQQPIREIEESAINVAAVTGFVGAGALIAKKFAAVKVPKEKQVADADIYPPQELEINEQLSAGARKADRPAPTVDSEEMVGLAGKKGGAAAVIAKKTSVGPAAQIQTSASPVAREAIQELVDSPFVVEKHTRGESVGMNVEQLSHAYDGRIAETSELLETEFTKLQRDLGVGFVEEKRLAAAALFKKDKNGKSSLTEFGKFDENVKTLVADPDMLKRAAESDSLQDIAAAKVAKAYRKMLDDVYDEAMALDNARVLDVDGNPIGDPLLGIHDIAAGRGRFVPRVYNHTDILDNYLTIRNAIVERMDRGSKDLTAKYAAATDITKDLTAKHAAASKTVAHIEGQTNAQRAVFNRASPGAEQASANTKLVKLQARLSDAQDVLKRTKSELAQPAKSFKLLSRQVHALKIAYNDQIADAVMRNVISGKTLRRSFNDAIGKPDTDALFERGVMSGRGKGAGSGVMSEEVMDPWLTKRASVFTNHWVQDKARAIARKKVLGETTTDEVIKEIDADYAALIASAKGNPDKINQLNVEHDLTVQNYRGVMDRVMNRYPVHRGKMNNVLSWIKTINGILRLGGAVFASGAEMARPAMVAGIKPYLRGIRQLLTSPQMQKLTVAQQKKMGIGVDRALGNGRFRAMADIDEMEASSMRAMVNNFGANYVSYLGPWTDVMKVWSGSLSSDGFLRAALAGKNKARFASLGIDNAMLKRIGAEVTEARKLDSFNDDLWGMPVAHRWADPQAKEAYEAAMRSEANYTISTPGAGDKPLFLDDNIWQVIFQFKSFILSAGNRMAIRGIQTAEAEHFLGLILYGAMTAAAMELRSYMYRDKSNYFDDFDGTAKDWTEFAIDLTKDSGMLGIYSPLAQTGLNFSKGGSTSWNAARAGNEIVGPTPGLVEDIYKIADEGMEGEVDTLKRLATKPIAIGLTIEAVERFGILNK